MRRGYKQQQQQQRKSDENTHACINVTRTCRSRSLIRVYVSVLQQRCDEIIREVQSIVSRSKTSAIHAVRTIIVNRCTIPYRDVPVCLALQGFACLETLRLQKTFNDDNAPQDRRFTRMRFLRGIRKVVLFVNSLL